MNGINSEVFTDHSKSNQEINEKWCKMLVVASEHIEEYVSHLNRDLHSEKYCQSASKTTIEEHLKDHRAGIGYQFVEHYGRLTRRQFYEMVHGKLQTICTLLENGTKIVLFKPDANSEMNTLLPRVLLTLYDWIIFITIALTMQ